LDSDVNRLSTLFLTILPQMYGDFSATRSSFPNGDGRYRVRLSYTGKVCLQPNCASRGRTGVLELSRRSRFVVGPHIPYEITLRVRARLMPADDVMLAGQAGSCLGEIGRSLGVQEATSTTC
jgi:hypothetical protein